MDPLAIALKEITEAKDLLQSLVISSEQFDYVQAKGGLKKLNRKIRDLRRTETEFKALLAARTPNLRVIDFQQSGRAGDSRL
jgi:hypothetical protein